MECRGRSWGTRKNNPAGVVAGKILCRRRQPILPRRVGDDPDVPETFAPLTDPAARRLVELQIIDERRHAGVYRAYLEDIGPLQPIDPMLEAAYETALSWDGDDGAMLAAFTIILEGEALFVLNDLGRWLRCPRFHRIDAGISRDEARHYAFGRAYLSQVFPTLGRRRRLDVYSRRRGLWHDTALGILERFRIPNFILRRWCRTWVDTGWRDHRKALIGTGLVTDSETPMAEGRPG